MGSLNKKKFNKLLLLSEGIGQSIMGAFFGLIFIFLCFAILNYFSVVDLPVIFPFLSFLPQKASLSLSPPVFQTSLNQGSSAPKTPITDFVEQCPIQQNGNALVRTVIPMDGGSVSALLGNVNSVSYDPATKTAQVDLIAINGAQEHTFQLVDQNNLVFDVGNNIPKTLADIKIGQSLQLSVQCNSYTKNQFTITQVAIEP